MLSAMNGMNTEYNIREIRFSVLSPEQIDKLSVVNVTEANLYSKGIPNSGTVMDLRLGSSDRRLRCSTCRHSSAVCSGHTGKIELAIPVVHWLYMDTVIKVLRSVCFWCSSCLIDVEDRSTVRRFTSKVGGKRLSAISSHCKGKTCPQCQGSQPEWNKNGLLIKAKWPPTQFENEEDEKFAKQTMTAALIRNILEFIVEKDTDFLGVKNPHYMVMTKMLVPPVQMRPTTSLTDGSRTKGHDDLSCILREITKDNEKIKEELSKGNEVPAKEHESLLINMISYFDKDAAGSQQLSLGGTGVSRLARKHNRSGPQMSLGRRLAGKRGRFRGTITGKRVDYTSRSVITPEPTLDIWQLAVPSFVARKQSIEVPVTSFNLEMLRQCVRRGDCEEGGGAHSITTPENQQIHLAMAQDLDILADTLSPGYKVRRHLRDGDWVIFNRQPTLHKMGMMGHEVKVVPNQNTFGLPVPCTPPYNADFDGDEMNMHTVQSLPAISEVKEILSVPNQLISAKDCRPSMYPVQDTVIGSFILTRMDTFIKRQYFFDYVMTIRYASKPIPKPAIMYRTESGKWESLYTGLQLVNYLTPPKIFFQKGVRDFDPEGDRFEAGFSDPDQRLVVVHDGDVCMGKLCKGTIGGCANGFIQRIHYMHGNWRAAQWISDLQRVVATWFPSHGFSIGLEDCLPSEEIERKVGIVVKKSIEAIKRGTKLAREKGVSEERIEQQCMKVASSVMSQSARVILNSVDRKNNILQCIQSGAKGKPMNICQILGVLGQQVSSGKRIFDLYNSKGRTLSCYDDEDADDPISHGLVTGSYRDGLACESYFFHCMTGREGLIDTACKTAETGYLQRRVIKVLESVYAASDGSVRDGADGNLISTRYAGDGQDPEKLVQVPVPILKKTGDPLAVCEAWCRGSGEEALTLSRIYAKVRHILNKNKNNRGRLYLAFDAEVEIPMPSSDVPPIAWKDLKDPIERACCKLARIVGERRSVMHMELSIRTSFAATRLGRVTPTSVKAALESIVSRVERAKIAAGSSIGTLAGTSIGEPATQMTLNTFHAAGTGNVTVSRGVPRFKELIDLSKNPATPSLRIYLNPSLRSDVDIATRLAHDLPGKYLKDFVERMELVLDEDPTTSTIEGDRCMVEVHNSIAPPVAKADWSRWIARLVLKKKKMIASNLTVAHVRSALRANFGEKIRVITSQPMDEEWICRVRISKTANALKLEKLRDLADHERMNLEKLALDEIMVTMVEEARICGISSIKQAFVSKKQGEYVIDTDGTSLEQVLSSGDLIDYRRCTSNSVHESFKCLGVEAAQNIIRLETQDVINDSGDVHVGHLDLLSQKMNVAGQPLPVTRHGMKRGQTGVLAAASFERTVDTFLHAAVHSETDRAGGVTESIVLGRLTRMGTGSVRLVHDKEMLKKIAAKKMSDQNVKLRFIGRKKGGYRKRRTVFWDFTSDPIHRVHVVQDSMRRVFTPPPVSSFADEDEPMTPPTDDDEDMLDCSAGRCETPPPATMMFGRWPIQMLMPQKPVWTIRMPMPKVVVVSQS